MKPYIHYNIWNKEQHIKHILKGINKFVDRNSFIDITFENPQDNSVGEFENLKSKYLEGYNFSSLIVSEKYRLKNANNAMRRFMQSDCDFFLTPQDDQWIQDSGLIDNISNIYRKESNVGLIGLRDGFNYNFSNMISSHFSEKTGGTIRWLKSGEYAKVQAINDGAMIINKDAINRVGYFDAENFNAFYIEMDYSARCNKAGLSNFVLGAELVHIKLGAIPSELYKPELDYGAKDLSVLKSKHPDIF